MSRQHVADIKYVFNLKCWPKCVFGITVEFKVLALSVCLVSQ